MRAHFPCVALLCSLSLLAFDVIACSPVAGAQPPAPPTRAQQFAAADLVVLGKVRKQTLIDGYWTIKFRVSKVLKGETRRTLTIVVAPPQDCDELRGVFPVYLSEGEQRVYLKRSAQSKKVYHAIHAESPDS